MVYVCTATPTKNKTVSDAVDISIRNRIFRHAQAQLSKHFLFGDILEIDRNSLR